MSDTKAAKDAADVTEVPKGMDVVVTVPGTIVGSHDLQGTDGEERTDRPGEILGTPADTGENTTRGDARAKEMARTDYVTSEVDRANREELPKLGGNVADTWEPGDAKVDTKAAAKAREGNAAVVGAGPAITAKSTAKAVPLGDAKATAAANDVKVSPKVDK